MERGRERRVALAVYLAPQPQCGLQVRGRLIGELADGHQHITNNLIVTPQYVELRALLVKALASFPKARQSVAAVLEKMEGGAPQVTFTGKPMASQPLTIEARPEATA